jgi:hypothetical protein
MAEKYEISGNQRQKGMELDQNNGKRREEDGAKEEMRTS